MQSLPIFSKLVKKISIHRLHLKTNHADPLTSEKNEHCEGQENCELLKAVDSEERENLREDNNFDYYILLQPHRISLVRICFVIQNV